MTDELSTRDRLLLVGAELLQEADGGAVSTRAITERAGVQAPTLYYHFGNKQNLLDEVVSHGFRKFLLEHPRPAADGYHIAALAQAWDTHVAFGVEHPAFYAHTYARVEPGYKCGVVAVVEQMLLEAMEDASAILSVHPAQAAKMFLAASSGVIITLISEPDSTPDPNLSSQMRDAVLDAITTDEVHRAQQTARATGHHHGRGDGHDDEGECYAVR